MNQMQIQTTQKSLQKLPNNSYTKPLLNAIVIGSTGSVYNEMCRYKEKGEPLHMKVIELVPVSERLPALSKIYGNDKIAAILSKQITRALNNFNLRVGMNPEQITDLSYAIIDEAEQDQLAIQDILLFLDGLPKFRYGKVYDRMDMPTFFEMLEKYREERHLAYMNGKEEAHAQFKAMGDSNRTSQDIDKENNRNAMINYLKTK
jgi:hypothetical protein